MEINPLANLYDTTDTTSRIKGFYFKIRSLVVIKTCTINWKCSDILKGFCYVHIKIKEIINIVAHVWVYGFPVGKPINIVCGGMYVCFFPNCGKSLRTIHECVVCVSSCLFPSLYIFPVVCVCVCVRGKCGLRLGLIWQNIENNK